MAVPNEYESVTNIASVPTLPLIASEITDAKIGPTQGVHKSPILEPIKIPPIYPESPLPFRENLEKKVNNLSNTTWNLGIRSPTPKRKIITIEKIRRESAEIPRVLTSKLKKRVKNVKLKIKPVTTPKGLFLPPLSDPDKTIGRIGRMHGERIVTTPPIKANIIKRIMTI
jgi:hypothetical protein